MLAFIDLETRVPADQPLRTIKSLADRALAQLSPEFDRMYAQVGRPSQFIYTLQGAAASEEHGRSCTHAARRLNN